MDGSVGKALDDFLAQGGSWTNLPFFQEGAARHVVHKVDTRIEAGARILPAPQDVFRALQLTSFEDVKAVILGQDPYPTPGDAHGLAFSYIGARRLPASLQTILKELSSDLGQPMPRKGDLTPWAKQGVLLLNTALTTEAGVPGAHLKLGWSQLANEAVAAISTSRPHVVFLLWGGPARKRAEFIDRQKHLILEAGHPSPLNRLRDFEGSKPFSQANAWLEKKGMGAIEWRL